MLSVIFWWDPVGSSQKIDLQSVKWAKTAKLGDLAHFELFWGQNMAGCNLIWIKIPSLVYCQWFLVEIQLVPAKKLVFRVSNYYYLSDTDLQESLFTGIFNWFGALIYFFLSKFNSLCICGIAEFKYRFVNVLTFVFELRVFSPPWT